jgi:general nucleoside transport system ATP-binding protein
VGTSPFPSSPEPAPVVELEGIVKRYPGTVANDGAGLAVRPGEIHALVGENGSGKSTLMGVLAGELRPDAGTVRVDGRPAVFRSPAAALAAGIGLVHQQLRLVDGLTVWENVVLGREPTRPSFPVPRRLDTSAARRRVAELGAAYDLGLDPDELVGRLRYPDRLRVELLRLLHRDGRVLVLDEPTAALFPAEARELLERLSGLTGRGVAIVLVSHRLDEVVAVADTVTVMRTGRTVATRRRGDVDVAGLAALVGGGPSPAPPSVAPVPPAGRDAVELAVAGAEVADRDGRLVVRAVDLEVRRGRVVGLAGLAGDGPVELLEALAGLRPLASGRVVVGGVDVTGGGPAERRRRGVRVVLEEAHRSCLLPTSPLWENVVLGHQRTGPLSRGPWIDRRAARRRARDLCQELAVRARSVDVAASALSGGNQQKLVVGRELAGEPRLLLVAHPTQGVDVASRSVVHAALERARAGGTAVVLVSSDPEELAGLADVVLVMRRGEVVARLEGPGLSAERVAVLMAGGSPA